MNRFDGLQRLVLPVGWDDGGKPRVIAPLHSGSRRPGSSRRPAIELTAGLMSACRRRAAITGLEEAERAAADEVERVR